MITIVGAGLSGLSAAYHLKEDYTLLEKEKNVGGLCRSTKINGYIFDYAPHILFTRDQYTRDLFHKLLAGNLHVQNRRAYIYLQSTYVRYPFEANLYPLPEKTKKECIKGVINKPSLQPENFYDWIQATMGPGIAEHYMVPYNEKIWKYPLEKLNTKWIESRVPSPSVDDIKKGAKNPQPMEYGPNAEFWYPEKEGIQALPESLAENTSVKLGAEAICFNPSNSGVETRYIKDGVENIIESEKVISSIPLPEIIKYMDGVPDAVQEAAQKLVYNSLICVMIGVKRPDLTNKHWIYYPEPEFIFNRISFPMNFSQNTTPEDRSSILVEVTYRNQLRDLEETKKRVLRDLIKTDLINEDDKFEVCETREFKYAYVIYDLNHQNNVKIIHDYLLEHNIVPIGRFGEWEYHNMDKAILSGKKSVERINQ